MESMYSFYSLLIDRKDCITLDKSLVMFNVPVFSPP